LETLPANKINPVVLSLIKYMKGLLQTNSGVSIKARIIIIPAEAAAASEPCSFTSIKAF